MRLFYYDTKPWTAPRARKYAPKPTDPGQPVTWMCEGETRTGTVWSVADVASALYVLPDSNPTAPVYVRKASKRDYGVEPGTWLEVPGQADADRLNVLRAERIRRSGIFSVVRSIPLGGRKADQRVTWHSDPDCPCIGNDLPYDANEDGYAVGANVPGKYMPWTVIEVCLALTSHAQAPSELCLECIVELDVAPSAAVTEPEPVVEPATEDAAEFAPAAPGKAVVVAYMPAPGVPTYPTTYLVRKPAVAGRTNGGNMLLDNTMTYGDAITLLDGLGVTDPDYVLTAATRHGSHEVQLTDARADSVVMVTRSGSAFHVTFASSDEPSDWEASPAFYQHPGTCECGYPLAEHIGQKPCITSPPSKVRGLYDLPVFDWAWTGDARDKQA